MDGWYHEVGGVEVNGGGGCLLGDCDNWYRGVSGSNSSSYNTLLTHSYRWAVVVADMIGRGVSGGVTRSTRGRLFLATSNVPFH